MIIPPPWHIFDDESNHKIASSADSVFLLVDLLGYHSTNSSHVSEEEAGMWRRRQTEVAAANRQTAKGNFEKDIEEDTAISCQICCFKQKVLIIPFSFKIVGNYRQHEEPQGYVTRAQTPSSSPP